MPRLPGNRLKEIWHGAFGHGVWMYRRRYIGVGALIDDHSRYISCTCGLVIEITMTGLDPAAFVTEPGIGAIVMPWEPHATAVGVNLISRVMFADRFRS